MFNSWLTRLTAPLAAISLCSGMAFLSGCNNDYNECDHHASCDTCAEGGVRVSEVPTTTTEYRAEDVKNEERARFDTSMDRDYRSSRWNQSDMDAKRQRLIEIDREKVLYPDRAAALDAEASRLKLEINEPASVNVRNDNIIVRDRSNMDTFKSETGRVDNLNAAPAPSAETKKADANAAAQPKVSTQAAPAPSAEVKKEENINTPAQPKIENTVNVAAPSTPAQPADTKSDVKKEDVNAANPPSDKSAAPANAPSDKAAAPANAPSDEKPASAPANTGIESKPADAKADSSSATGTETPK